MNPILLDIQFGELSGWPLAFVIVGCAISLCIMWGTVVTERWPWEK